MESLDYLSGQDQNAWGFVQLYMLAGIVCGPLFVLPALGLSLAGYGAVLLTRNWSRFEIDAIVVAVLLCATLLMFTNLMWKDMLDLLDLRMWLLVGIVLAPLMVRSVLRSRNQPGVPETSLPSHL
jgi:hypothetical protein